MKLACVLILLCVTVCAHARVYNVRDYGAKGDGKTKDTQAIEKVLSLIKEDGYGTLLFPTGGVYYTAPFNLTSNIVVMIEKNATILGSLDVSDYPVIPPLPSYCQGREMDGPRYSTLIHAEHANNITITGGGIIDGSGKPWWDMYRNKTLQHTRGGLVEIMWCEHLEISHITLQNSPFWTVHPYTCNDVVVSHVTIVNPSDSPNTDGVDPDSSTNVLITDCNISVGDDVIAIKSGWDWCGREYAKPTENVTIQNTVFGAGHGISIGSEMSGGVRNVTITNCVVNGTQAAVRIKTQRGRGGVVENITYSDLTLYGNVQNAISVDMFYSGDLPVTNATATPVFRDVTIRNIKGGAKTAGLFRCLPESPCVEFDVDHVVLQTSQGFTCSNVQGNFSDVFPNLCFPNKFRLG